MLTWSRNIENLRVKIYITILFKKSYFRCLVFEELAIEFVIVKRTLLPFIVLKSFPFYNINWLVSFSYFNLNFCDNIKVDLVLIICVCFSFLYI